MKSAEDRKVIPVMSVAQIGNPSHSSATDYEGNSVLLFGDKCGDGDEAHISMQFIHH